MIVKPPGDVLVVKADLFVCEALSHFGDISIRAAVR